MSRATRGLLIAVISLVMIPAGRLPVAAAAGGGEPLPQTPVPSARPAVTPIVTSIPAQAVVSAKSTQGAVTEIAAVPAQHTATFSLVGATWTAMTGSVSLQVRVQNSAGWSDWTDLSVEDGLEGNAPSRSTEPVFVGDSTGVELRAMGAAGTSVTGLAASTVTSPAVADDAHLAPISSKSVATTTGIPQPAIISRAGWGANESLRTSCSNGTYDTTVKAAVIHHTAGSNDYTSAESASIVRAIYAYHVQSNGWCDIGYNFLVDKYGQIFEGRWGGIDRPVHGAHASSWNTNTMGVSFMMNTVTAAASEASVAAATSLLAWKLGGYYRDPNGTTTLVGATFPVIFGHGDVMATECPGTDLRARMQEIRDRTGAVMANRQRTPLYNLWVAAGGDGSSLGPVTVIERSVGDGRAVTFQNGAGYERPDGAAFWLGAGIDTMYQNAGGPTGSYGWPTSNQVTVSGELVKATFEHGTITYPDVAPYVAFVKATYQDFLGRAPSQAEIDSQSQALGTGTPVLNYLNSLSKSDEWLTKIVTGFYQNTLGRAPDAGGLANWLGVLRSGRMTVAQVAAQFYASEEFYRFHAGNTNTTWVTELYRQILHRDPDAGGLQAWVNLTNSGRMDRGSIAENFYQSTESRMDRVAALYQALLKRAPDPTGWPYWTAQVLTTGDLWLAVSLASSQEYWNLAHTRY